MMRKNKKLYWLSFALQFTLAILAFLKIDNLAYANFVAIWLALIWILCWLPVHIKKYRENKQLSRKIGFYMVLIFALLEYAVVLFPTHKKMIDFFVLLYLNFGLIADDIIIWLGNKKDQD